MCASDNFVVWHNIIIQYAIYIQRIYMSAASPTFTRSPRITSDMEHKSGLINVDTLFDNGSIYYVTYTVKYIIMHQYNISYS